MGVLSKEGDYYRRMSVNLREAAAVRAKLLHPPTSVPRLNSDRGPLITPLRFTQYLKLDIGSFELSLYSFHHIVRTLDHWHFAEHTL